MLRRRVLFLQEQLRKVNARRMAVEQQLREAQGRSPLVRTEDRRRRVR
ncbi:hypothetical protein [Humisphaera borealis]|uniref:Uncharacterized protein n=1 Tax=Humisphaera borealis TaxID=2807512 RepID=A0A7M2X2M9_9BACT|nr:hypothetical protein [Humisphaera borealis]QOV91682.1 hypothetical protein IPV69_10085 [Humisphaera borealis]